MAATDIGWVVIGRAIGPSDDGDGLLNNAGWHVNSHATDDAKHR